MKTKEPKITIITINLNNEAGLRKTIESVVNQDFDDLEYIVIDGGSKDGSRNIIKEYVENIDYWVSEEDKGIYNAMNKGINKSNGVFLLFLNSGDFLCSNNVINRINEIIRIDDDILVGNTILDYPKGRKIRKNPKEIGPSFFLRKSISHQACFIRKTLFDKYGLYSEKYETSSDKDFFIRALIMNDAKYRYVDFNISIFDIGGIGSSEKYKELRKKEKQNIYENYFSKRMLISFERFNRVRYIADSRAFINIYDFLLDVYRASSRFFNKLFSKV